MNQQQQLRLPPPQSPGIMMQEQQQQQQARGRPNLTSYYNSSINNQYPVPSMPPSPSNFGGTPNGRLMFGKPTSSTPNSSNNNGRPSSAQPMRTVSRQEINNNMNRMNNRQQRPTSASPAAVKSAHFTMGGTEPLKPSERKIGRKHFVNAPTIITTTTSSSDKLDVAETLTMTSSGLRTSKSDLDKPFHSLYQAYCRRIRIEPLEFIVANSLTKGLFEIDLDLIPQEHWKRCLAALKNSRQSFNSIRIAWGESNYVRDFSTITNNKPKTTSSSPSLLSIKESMLIHQMRSTNQLERKTSSRSINLVDPITYADSLKFVRILAPCFSAFLSKLEIIGIPISKQCTSFMQKGLLEAKSSLRCLSLKNTGLGDEAFRDIGCLLTQFIKLSKLTVSGCCLSDDSSQYILNLMRERINQKSHEAWLVSLRGNQEAYDSIEDLTSLDLSDNYFSDSTAKAMSHILYDDQTLKKLNLSKNIIGVTGISLFFDVVVHNEVIDYIDLSANFGVTEFSEKFDSHTLFTNFFDSHDFIFQRISKRKKKKTSEGEEKTKTSKNGKKKDSKIVKLKVPSKSDRDAHQELESLASDSLSPRSDETDESGYESCTGRIEGNDKKSKEEEEKEKKKAEEREEKTLRLKRESELINMQIEFKNMDDLLVKLKKNKFENENRIQSQERSLTDLQQALVQLTQLVNELQEEKQTLNKQLIDTNEKLEKSQTNVQSLTSIVEANSNSSKRKDFIQPDIHIDPSLKPSQVANEDIAFRITELFNKKK
ncbi:predicted protein [Naegleria gruberi]|uniref:Predicted protein n=1 Tax=Naegleria gruberi TaxID=5762 RepID=D2VTI2_NAEGR|nr:uncharacterized protein NAEGRDRAFT_72311 [Naegleria gruberi]EFC39864.1 predicted protein [Naegleria gruberi]|eukprot:XP_002672608.1 predicted protein [Naegleria gruberi strain NEG-M]